MRNPARKVFIAIPVHDGTLRVGTVMSLVAAINEGVHSDLSLELHCWVGDSLLPHARNTLVAQFIASDCDDLVFWDADISCAPGSLARLLNHPVDFVAGTYRFKNDLEGYPIRWLREDNEVSEHGLFEVASVPGGFFRMTRAGLERVTGKCEHLVYRSHNAQNLKHWCLFNLVLKDQQFYGEDYVFCDLIRELGETIWLDPDLSLTHSGSKEYMGNLGAFIAEQERQAAPADEKEVLHQKLLAFAKSFATPEVEKLLAIAAGEKKAA